MPHKQTLEFSVSLQGWGVKTQGGFRAAPYELLGQEFRFDMEHGDGTSIADSIQALQGAGMIHAPTYLLVSGSARKGPKWFDILHGLGLGERLIVSVPHGRYGIPSGDYVIDVQNGGISLPRPNLIRDCINGGGGDEEAFGPLEILKQDKDLLLGEKRVYQWNGKSLQEVPIHIFGSYDEFLEASAKPSFLDNMPVYAVLRSKLDAQKNSTLKRDFLGST
ncbi:hypothetical protein HYV80_00955 [Candidatus Woesearchaeota archaeon]|nr:hypothetical protein [Candidatus Woesearchaeota archaeon]